MNKIIHYFYDDINIWEKNASPQFRMCFASWKKFCPDYEIKLWHVDMPEFQDMLKSSKFLRECYKRKMWAFISDYVRYYALYNYGGIYLDTDVQLLKSFDDFINLPFFVSIEGDIIDGNNIPEPAILGGEKEHWLFKEILNLYNSDEIFKINFPIANNIMAKILYEKLKFSKIPYLENLEKEVCENYNSQIHCKPISSYKLYLNQKVYENDDIYIFPSEYFCPSWSAFGEKAFTSNTVAIHWAQSSWWSGKSKLRDIEAFRYKNVIKRFWYRYSEKFAKIITCLIPNKKARIYIRNKITLT